MLAGLEEIDWATYEGAYGPAEEAPHILRAIASPDPETAREGRYEFTSSLWHQGTVYPVTVMAVPFLVELATTPGVHQRPDLLHVLGALCDPEQSDGDDQPAVRAAVAEHSDVLLSQLADADPEVRECAAYALARCGRHTRQALAERWALEEDARVRASLLLGIALHDPAGCADRLRSAAKSEPSPVPAAAALALARAGLPVPSETIAPIAAAFASDDEWRSPWQGHADALSEVLDRVDAATANAITAALTDGAPGPSGPSRRTRGAGATPTARIRAANAMTDRFRSRRSAPADLMPRLRALLTDADADVRAAAVQAAAHAGVPAAAVASVLASIAGGGDDDGRGPAGTALNTLIRLGDHRWREPVLSAWAAGRDPGAMYVLADYRPAFDPDVFVALRRRLAAQLAAGLTGNPVIHLVSLVHSWGPAAADAVPDLLAALPAAPWVTPAALAEIGPAALDAVPALREAAHTGQVRAGHAVWRLTGDAGPLISAASARLASSRSNLAWELDLVADAGPSAAPLVPALRGRLTGAPGTTHPERDEQIAAARLVWRATGAAAEVLSTVAAVLGAGDVPVRSAAKLAAEMAPVAGAELARGLREALGNEYGRVDAARALWRHGTAVGDLVDPLLTAVADPYGDKGALALLVEMGGVDAVPGLVELADRDERVVTYGSYDETVWLDDRLRRDLYTAVATLSSSAEPG
ncbi:hypothetical protein ABZ793_19130 [Micromonospora sp. NPDC047465]|uniref:hypothetical protein n=1 Tax=Micromonospora sp. NPDC047465 TaxID=3154813 RepID=UPI00340FA4C4